jgi:hypothetical protein
MRSALILSIALGLAQTVPSAARSYEAAHTTIHHWSVIVAKATALAPSSVLAESDADGYPPGLFENSPLVEPNHPAKQARPSAPGGPSAHRSQTLGKSGPQPPA